MSKNEKGEVVITLSPATAHLVNSMFEESRAREEKETRYMRGAESYVEVLLDYAIRRKQSEYQSRDKQALGKSLREALDKVVNGKPLTNEETKLVQTFQKAAQPVAAQPAS